MTRKSDRQDQDRSPTPRAERGAGGAGREAARTTIVGGQPPGNAREVPPVPIGLEQLLGLAAASEAFATALHRDPLAAAAAAGVELTASERAIVAAVRGPALSAMIAQVGPALPEPDRRRFLEVATAAATLLVSGAALAGCEETKPGAGGRTTPSERPEHPAAATGARPDRPEDRQTDTGARPDRPRHPDGGTGAHPDRPEHPATGTGARPDRPEHPATGTGARPDRPAQTTTGVRPDRPEERYNETGARPDRPNEPPPPTGIRPDRPPRPPRPAPDAGAPRAADDHARPRSDRRDKLCITGSRPDDE